MVQKQPHIDDNSFKQFVLDFNVRTVDGYGIFHSMGGIMCYVCHTWECSELFKGLECTVLPMILSPGVLCTIKNS